MADRPRLIDEEVYRSFCSDLAAGEYTFTTVEDELWDAAARFAQSASTDNEFAGLLAMSSTSSASPQPIKGIRPRPGSRVVSIRRIRPDSGSTEFHVNMDDALLFEDEQGNTWLHTPERDDHYDSSVSRDAGLTGYLRPFGLEEVPSRGSVEDLRDQGVLVSFTT